MTGKSASQWYEDGVELLDSGFFDSAIRCFDEILEVEPRNTRAWVLKATALSGSERYEEAMQCLDRALEIDPTDVQAWKGKALTLIRLGRHDEAAQCQERAEKIARGVDKPPTEEKKPIVRAYGVADGLVSDTVRCLAANEQEVWFGYGGDGGVTRLTLHDRRFTTYTSRDGLSSEAVRCVVLGKKDVWLGTNRGLSRFATQPEEWTAYTQDRGLQAQLINDIAVEGELLWLATDSGLVVFDTLTGRSVVCPAGPGSPVVEHLLVEGTRVWCWANQEGNALRVFDKQAETSESVVVGPLVQGMQLFPRMGENRIWVARTDGITIVERSTHKIEEIPLPAMVITGIAPGVQNLLIPTARGLATVDAREANTGQTVRVKRTEVGRGQYVSAVCASLTREWIALEGQGVLCLSYSS